MEWTKELDSVENKPVWARLEVVGKFNKETLDSINLSIWANALGSLGFMVIDSIRLIDHEDEVLG